jgi:hypothetical protein
VTVAIDPEGRGVLTIKITGVASADNAGVGQVLNPEGVNLVILRTSFYVHVASTGAANLGIGVGASGAKATDILNDLAVNGAITDKVYNGHVMQNAAKTEIQAPALWTTDKYITFTGSASTVGLEAYLFVEYVRAV